MTWTFGTAVLVLLIMRVDGVLNEELLQLNCPSNTYPVNRTQSSKKTMISVKDQRDICERIIHDRSFELISNDDLRPLRSVIKINGEYYLKFTWKSSVVDGKYPRRFLLLLKYTIPKRKLQRNCVVLELNRRKAESHETFSEFSFHCIKLREVSDAEVSIQVWNYSQRQYNTGCRRIRSLGHHNTCTRVECSDKQHHSLALESYQTEICSCYQSIHGKPKVEKEIITGSGTIDFILNVTNLPDFLASIQLEVFRDGATVWSETIDPLIIQGCKNNGMYKETSSKCHKTKSYDTFLTEDTAPHVKDTEIPSSVRSLSFAVGILIGVAVAASSTIIVFFVYIRRYKQRTSNRSPQGYAQAPNNTPSSQDETSPDETIELLNVPRWKPGRKVLLLYHPPDLNPTLKQVMSQLNMDLVNGRNENWQTFSMDAVLKYYNVVILMSTGLFELLCGNGCEKEARRVERQYENVPELVLQHLKLLTTSVPNRKDFFVHFVSTNCDNGKCLISKFLPECEFLKLTKNYCVYFLTNDLSVQLTDDSEFNKLKYNLEHSPTINSQPSS